MVRVKVCPNLTMRFLTCTEKAVATANACVVSAVVCATAAENAATVCAAAAAASFEEITAASAAIAAACVYSRIHDVSKWQVQSYMASVST